MKRRLLPLLCALLFAASSFSGSAETVASSKNASLKLLSCLYSGQNTLVFSPLSLSVALSMASDGASGVTAAQLDAFLDDSRPRASVLEELSCSDVHMANAAFLRSGFDITPEYENELEKYDASVNAMNQSDVAAQVNEWVSENTDGRIGDFLSKEPDANVQLLLVNALSMQAEWLHPFSGANTSFAVFRAPEGDVEVSSMNQTETFAYAEVGGVQSVALPYRSNDDMLNTPLEMIVLLPEDGQLQPLVDQLSADPDAFLAKYAPAEEVLVQLSLPVTHAESSFEMKEALIELGVTDAFDADAADFSAMSPQADDLSLCIGSVLQKTMLNVTESGTEAASATQVEMLSRGAMPPNTVQMNVDRPYLLLIHAPVSGYILFVACINNPA